MEFEALRLFLAVAEQESFTRASIKLGITQPALSRHVQRLEEDCDAQLFYRHGRGVILTEAGKRLKAVSEDVLKQLREVKDELSAASAGHRGSVVLGLPPSLGATLAVPLMRRFREDYPDARLTIMEGFSGTLLEWLEAGRIDVGVLYDARRSRTLLVTPILREHLFLIQRPDAPGCGPARIEELAEGPFALSSPSHGMRRVVDSATAKAGVGVHVTAEIDSVVAIRQLVEAGPERAVLPFGAVHREVAEGKLTARRIDHEDMQALLVTATPLHKPVTKLTSAVLRLIDGEVRRCVSDRILSGLAGPAAREKGESWSDHVGLDEGQAVGQP